MRLRLKIARGLRKWADLLDPRVNPTEVMTIRVECDTSQFDGTLKDLHRRLALFLRAVEEANES